MLRKADKYILFSAVFLILIGFIMILSVAPIALRDHGDGFYYVKRHLCYLLLGAVVCAAALRLDSQKLRRLAAPGLLLSLILLGLTYIPALSISVGGAARWIRLGAVSFQPAELAKVFIILYIAQALAQKKAMVRDFWRGVFPLLAVSGVLILGILLQPDLGTSLVIAATVLAMLAAASSNLADIFLLALLGFRALVFWVMRHPYQLKRLMVFLNPWQDPLDAGYNTKQSLIAVGSGGLLGLGLGHSRQKFSWLPENHTDFIFAVICEEGGFLLAALVVAAFAVLVVRGLRLAARAAAPFDGFLALGYSLCLGIQALVNMMVVTAMLPTKGITLPFVSYGGTSLLVSLFMLGVILRISRDTG
ncbi:MAG: putative lipid II flippase FtsW [Candidatus Margulisbacteria bacterium]|jgi:cell division protein FtsW|nr:putative lipid II flippase FtsW [Candidatus Margulisiibacteriota bacterium]